MWFVLVGYTEGWEVLGGKSYTTKEAAWEYLAKEATIGGPRYAVVDAGKSLCRMTAQPKWETVPQ